MFGYVRPLRGELKVRQWEDYQAAYCGLCHCLKHRCGLAARFTLNYDFVFLALLLESEEQTPCQRRCVAHPFRKKRCLCPTSAMDLAAEESVILAYHKLLDDQADEGFWKGLGGRMACLLLRRAYKKAQKSQPDFDAHVARCLGELKELEKARSTSLDRTADTFARLLQGAAPTADAPAHDRPMAQLLYHLGRWIYLADAADDAQEDAAKGRYNPVLARFDGKPDLEYLGTTMTHSLSLAQSALELLPTTRWTELLQNVLYLGLPAIQKAALAGEWTKRDKKNRSMRT